VALNQSFCLLRKRLPATGFFSYKRARPKMKLLICMNPCNELKKRLEVIRVAAKKKKGKKK
jgi:hypothetical protein